MQQHINAKNINVVKERKKAEIFFVLRSKSRKLTTKAKEIVKTEDILSLTSPAWVSITFSLIIVPKS